MAKKLNVKILLQALKKQYPKAKISLNYKNSLELLVATILSAQCTDKMVNKVTESLFKKYKSSRDYANADINKFEQDIRSTGFYRNKAKNIKVACKILLESHGGRVPDTMLELLALPGVARKTANIVLQNAFGKIEGIPVDTHVKKASYKFGLSDNQNTDKIEQDLMKLFPKSEWYGLTYRIIEHGRDCRYKKQDCKICKFIVK